MTLPILTYRTAKQAGLIIPVVITVYKDKSFEFITKEPPMAVLIKKPEHCPQNWVETKN